MVTEWHWTAKANFGDRLTGPILEYFCDLDVEYTPFIRGADVVAVGSVLSLLPHDWAGTVIGSGKLHQNSVFRAHDATVLAVRGPESARGIPGDYALGDLGLLAGHLIAPQSRRHAIGVVPHWSDTQMWPRERERLRQYDPVYIDVAAEPLSVVRQIASCRKIVTSSLHALIVADSFGIPRRFEYTPRFDREGGVFKFLDYSASIGTPFEAGRLTQANRFRVERTQEDLIDVLEMYKTIATTHV